MEECPNCKGSLIDKDDPKSIRLRMYCSQPDCGHQLLPKRDDLFDPNQLKNLKSLPLKSYEVIANEYKDLDDLFEYRYDTATDFFLRRAKSLIDEILCYNLKFEGFSKTLDRSIMHKKKRIKLFISKNVREFFSLLPLNFYFKLFIYFEN